jgi:hypothetical protein
VTTIGAAAFMGCASLASITIPEMVIEIGWEAFHGCTSLASITLPETLTTIGGWAFYECTSLASATIPEGVTTIGEYTFSKCTSLASVTIPEGVTTIGNETFERCTWLVTATIPQSCATIYEKAFNNCPNLSIVVAPPSLEVKVLEEGTYIEGKIDAVFNNCPLLDPPHFITPYSRAALCKANRLEYWSIDTHFLCKPKQRNWIFFVLLVFNHIELPIVVQLKILGMLRRHELCIKES